MNTPTDPKDKEQHMTKDEYINRLGEILGSLWTKETPFGQQIEGLEEAITAIQQLNNEAIPNKTIGAPVGDR